MEIIEKYIPLILAIALTVGGYFIERSILSPVQPSMAGLSWIFFGLSGFVFFALGHRYVCHRSDV